MTSHDLRVPWWQSEQEKLLRKHFRKEEKKLAKKEKDFQTPVDQASHLKYRGFDLQEMRRERYIVCLFL